MIASAPGRWFELRKGGVATGYLQAEESHGRYAAKLPESIDRTTVIPLEIPYPPPTDLRRFLSALIDQAATRNPDSMTALSRCRDALNQPEDRAAFLETRVFASALAAGAGMKLPEPAVMEEYRADLHERFVHFTLRGEVAGIMTLLCKVADKSGPLGALTQSLRRTPATPVQDIAGFGDFVLSGVASQSAGMEWIEAAAHDLRDGAEAKLTDAAGARSIGAFYGAIYESIPLAYGAKRAFAFLALRPEHESSARCRLLANQCDERFATGMAALKADFGNSMDWRFLLSHRALAEKQRHLSGEAGAEGVAMEVIDIAMMYPGFFRPFLLGRTNTLPSAADEPARS